MRDGLVYEEAEEKRYLGKVGGGEALETRRDETRDERRETRRDQTRHRRCEWSVTHQRFPALSHSTHRPVDLLFFLSSADGTGFAFSLVGDLQGRKMWSVGRAYNNTS